MFLEKLNIGDTNKASNNILEMSWGPVTIWYPELYSASDRGYCLLSPLSEESKNKKIEMQIPEIGMNVEIKNYKVVSLEE